MSRTPQRNVFGIAEPQVVRIGFKPLHLPFYALLGLQPAQEEWVWLGLIHTATNWGFRQDRLHPLKTDEGYTFPVYHIQRTGNIATLIRNLDENGQIRLLDYQAPALNMLHSHPKTLPNQLSLFPEETGSTQQIDLEGKEYQEYNPDDLRQWNTITALLAGKSQPLTRFRYLLPISYQNFEAMTPFLCHLARIPGLQYRFITGTEIGNDQLFYIIRRHTDILAQRKKNYRSSGR